MAINNSANTAVYILVIHNSNMLHYLHKHLTIAIFVKFMLCNICETFVLLKLNSFMLSFRSEILGKRCDLSGV